jgi:death-on-curing protein
MLAAIHREPIAEHGGSSGVRDEGLIASALARPEHRLADDEEADLATLATAYGFGLAKNHGFVDGNERVAFMAMYVLLGLNGYDLDAPEPEAVRVMLRLAEGRLGEQQLADWLRAAMRPLGKAG